MKEQFLNYINKKESDILMPRKKITYGMIIDALIKHEDNAYITLGINKQTLQKHFKNLFPEKGLEKSWYKYIYQKLDTYIPNNIDSITGKLLNKVKKNHNSILFNNITFGQYFDDLQKYGKNTLKHYNANTRFNITLNKHFPNKPKNVAYHIYILDLLDLKKCGICASIKNSDEFTHKYNCKTCAAKEKKHWVSQNRDHIKSYDRANPKNSKRRANKLQAIPKWYEKDLVTELYKQSSKEIHIDHIIPLQSNVVCGLHCIDNLQPMRAKENISKSNSFDQDFESVEQMEWLIEHGVAC